MKKLCLAISILAVFIAPNVNAMENNDYIRVNQGDIQTQIENDKNLVQGKIELEKTIKELENQFQKLNSGITPLDLITDVRVGWLDEYPIYSQERSYWCGPATIKQAIQYMTGSSAPQSTYANNMGTNSQDGSIVWTMTRELNRNQTVHTYKHEMMYNWDLTGIWNRIVANTHSNIPSVLHTRTQYLYLYNGAQFGHYITAIGYHGIDYPDENKKINYIDTFAYNGGRGTTLGYHFDSLTNIANSVGGRYMIW